MKKINLLILPFVICACQETAAPEVTLEATANKIAAVRPVGKLQVMTSLMEDFDKEEIKQALMPGKGFIQILRERCSFAIDLEKISYKPLLNSKIVQVQMVYPEANCLLQDSPFMSDDEEYWREHLSNNDVNNIKKGIHLKNMQKFNTPENRLKAQAYGEEFIKKMLQNLGLEAEISWVKDK